MRVLSEKKPEREYSITKCGDKAELVFYTDISADEEGYSYTEARICVPYRENLAESVEKNISAWREMAQQPQAKPLTPGEEIQRLKAENALMGEALTQLILEVM